MAAAAEFSAENSLDIVVDDDLLDEHFEEIFESELAEVRIITNTCFLTLCLFLFLLFLFYFYFLYIIFILLLVSYCYNFIKVFQIGLY